MNRAIHDSDQGVRSQPLKGLRVVFLITLVIAFCLFGCVGTNPGAVDVWTQMGSLHWSTFDTNLVSETIIREHKK